MQTLLLSCVLMLGALTGAAPNFPIDMFETTSHNFGTVVKGTKTEFDFIFTNRYLEDVVVESVTSSCQCTTPSFEPRGVIKTNQKGRIHISVNTQNFTGTKNATITVRFSKPYRTEMQLHSYAVIRNDVSVSPGIVYFGSADPKTKPVQKVTVHSVNANWKIRDVQSECKFLKVTLQPQSTHYGSTYVMNIFLNENAPPGPFSEVLEIISNDYNQRQQRIPLKVQGRVKQTLSASPSPLAFNMVELEQKVEKILILQGASPFKITDITSESKNISASIEKTPKSIQRITLAYTGTKIGDFNGQIYVYTDLEGGISVPVKFSGKVIPASEPEPEPQPDSTLSSESNENDENAQPTQPLDPPEDTQTEPETSNDEESGSDENDDENDSDSEFQIEETPADDARHERQNSEPEAGNLETPASEEANSETEKEQKDEPEKRNASDDSLTPENDASEENETESAEDEAETEEPEVMLIPDDQKPETEVLEEAEHLLDLEPAENQNETDKESESADSLDLLALPEQQTAPGRLPQRLPNELRETERQAETADAAELDESPESDGAEGELPAELILDSDDEANEAETDEPGELDEPGESLPQTLEETSDAGSELPAQESDDSMEEPAGSPAMPQPKPAVIGRNLLKSKT